MQTINRHLNALAKLVGLFAVIFTLGPGSSQAALVKFQVKVPGYSQRGDGWVLVLPELRSILGGAVHWDSGRNCYITDRVARGETMKITISPQGAEQCFSLALLGISPGNTFTLNQAVWLPYVINGFVVSTNPAYDNVHLNLFTTLGPASFRIPIGSR